MWDYGNCCPLYENGVNDNCHLIKILLSVLDLGFHVDVTLTCTNIIAHQEHYPKAMALQMMRPPHPGTQIQLRNGLEEHNKELQTPGIPIHSNIHGMGWNQPTRPKGYTKQCARGYPVHALGRSGLVSNIVADLFLIVGKFWNHFGKYRSEYVKDLVLTLVPFRHFNAIVVY